MRIWIGNRKVANRPFLAQRALELRPLALGEVQTQAHRIRHRQDIGKQDRRIQIEARQRLQGHFARQLRVLAQLQEAARTTPCFVVFGQITSRLTHQPDWGVLHRLAQ